MKTKYNSDFYNSQKNESYLSAKHVIPLILEQYNPKSIIDVGCGVGSWLKAWTEFGIEDYLGIDGQYVDTSSLMIDKNKFFPADISTDFLVNKRFDLAQTLEVAEHIQGEKSADFVKKMCSLSDIILFSAALPFQGGTDHLNENWLEYWALLFREYKYVPIDFLRKKIWNNKNVCFWYQQNIIIFVKQEKAHFFTPNPILENSLSIIHPELLLWATSKLKNKLHETTENIQYHNQLVDSFRETKGSIPKLVRYYKNLLPNKKVTIFSRIIKKIVRFLSLNKL